MPLILKNTFFKQCFRMQNKLNSLDSLRHDSIFSLWIPKNLFPGNVENKLIRHNGSSKSRKASVNVGYLCNYRITSKILY